MQAGLVSAFCSGLIEIRADEPAFLRVFYQGIPTLDEGESQNKLPGNLLLFPLKFQTSFSLFSLKPLSPRSRSRQCRHPRKANSSQIEAKFGLDIHALS